MSCKLLGKASDFSESSADSQDSSFRRPKLAIMYADIPPSPDNTSGASNSAEYSSPGTHPSNDEGFEPDLDNASEAAKQDASGPTEVTI